MTFHTLVSLKYQKYLPKKKTVSYNGYWIGVGDDRSYDKKPVPSSQFKCYQVPPRIVMKEKDTSLLKVVIKVMK